MKNIRQTYFEIWGNEQAQNSILKGLLLGLSALFVVQSIALVCIALRKPVLIALGTDETRVLSVTPPSTDLLRQELKRTLSAYLQAHYTWDSSTVESAHVKASRYVSARFVSSFIQANQEQVRVAKEKNLEERVYIYNMDLDIQHLSARVLMDRILIVHSEGQGVPSSGLRAVSPWTLDVSFEYGPRSDQNPEGIYVTGEKQESP